MEAIKLRLKPIIQGFISIFLLITLISCNSPSGVIAEDRVFSDLSLEFLGEYQLTQKSFENTVIGGLSAITYNQKTGQFYVLSDDRSNISPARFYTMELNINQTNPANINIKNIEIKKVTLLKNEQGETYPLNTIDPEGIALSPRNTLFIASEGSIKDNFAPMIAEFDIETGNFLQNIPIPQRYLPDRQNERITQGIRENLGFESLNIHNNSLVSVDPFRLFTATESSLLQDGIPQNAEENTSIRLMHYIINPFGDPVLSAEHLYLLEPTDSYNISNGLTDLTTLKKEGYFLTLERTYGIFGANGKIFQMVIGNATDTSNYHSLKNITDEIEPVKKKLLLDLKTLGIRIDNLEGMTLGANLIDGSQSLILVSDDNFSDQQVTQFLLFRLINN
jgi:hypothetical protein